MQSGFFFYSLCYCLVNNFKWVFDIRKVVYSRCLRWASSSTSLCPVCIVAVVHIIFWFCCEKAALFAFKILSHISSIYVYNEILHLSSLCLKKEKKTLFSRNVNTHAVRISHKATATIQQLHHSLCHFIFAREMKRDETLFAFFLFIEMHKLRWRLA